ncbi:unnamed protein product [Ceutorhynchus assimilis]|uniref:Homeobox domain-containing protein n=1 Tax=Ceutorhynchus assimilis TaxID=467358 RepID=A0A9N9MS69_9CUCU|nr:unnamed protein product [Ceutorhynchus assimilis]
MSFRIEDILSDRNFFSNKQNAESSIKREEFFLPQQVSFQPNIVFERDRNKLANVPNIPIQFTSCQTHCLPCLESHSKEMTRNHFISGCGSYQGPKVCCSIAVPVHDKPYTSPYIYPEKIYSQTTTYSHVLPTFPMYQHYSRRRNQVRFSTSQTKALEHKFVWQKYLSPEDRKSLAHSLKLSDRQVKTWFQNRRAKWRRNANGSTNGDVKPDIIHTVN